MDSQEFRKAAHETIDFVINYIDTIRDRSPRSTVEPGYLRPLLPPTAPDDPDSFDDVMRDVDNVIMPGIAHRNSPHYHCYFPMSCSYPSALAEILTSVLDFPVFAWHASPVCTELEVVVMDWLAQLLGLPKHFLVTDGSGGGGVLQGSASEATLMAILVAKQRALRALQEGQVPDAPQDGSRLVAYTSDEAHCSVERACRLSHVRMRRLPVGHNYALRGDTLLAAITEDLQNGLVPFAVVATLGTTSSCAFDNLQEIAEVLSKFPRIWLHVDAAYAGSAYICEELRGTMVGIERADSFDFNAHKWLLVNLECSAMWVKDRKEYEGAYQVNAPYLKKVQQPEQHRDAPEYRHWTLPLCRRWRSLKLWFVLRMYGKKGLQQHIRKQVGMAKQFEELVLSDDRFEVVAPVTLGIVCFRLKVAGHGELNPLNERLLESINSAGEIYLVASQSCGLYYLRMVVYSRLTEPSDMVFAWEAIQQQTTALLTAGK